jgi:hypothetical protein
VRATAWERHENNIYDKITHWFEVVGKVLQDPAILPENADEQGVGSYNLVPEMDWLSEEQQIAPVAKMI